MKLASEQTAINSLQGSLPKHQLKKKKSYFLKNNYYKKLWRGKKGFPLCAKILLFLGLNPQASLKCELRHSPFMTTVCSSELVN